MTDVSFVKSPLVECHCTLLMICEHGFRYWLGAVRQQVITWANVHSVPYIVYLYSLSILDNENCTGYPKWGIKIGSDNGIVPSGEKPLTDAILTHNYVAIWPNWVNHSSPMYMYGLLTRYAKLQVALAPRMAGIFCAPPRVSDAGMHRGTCLTHVPWCMPGSLTNGFLWSR